MIFVPYGFIPGGPEANRDPTRPERFHGADGSPATDAAWLEWNESMADELAGFLWPRWQPTGWQGAATATMQALTEADLALMPALALQLDQSPPGVRVKHASLFLAEDARPPSTAGLLHYAALAPAGLLRQFDALLLAGGAIAGAVAFNLKRRLQRPRPHQTAFHLPAAQAAAFTYRAASSATTASMVSGHCIQGSLALANVVVGYESGPARRLPAPLLDAVTRYFIDGGDRRVFAGVHYPSDNVSSWFVALRLCDHVFSGAAARARARHVLWRGIQGSEVFMALRQAVRANPASPLALPLQRLEAEAARA